MPKTATFVIPHHNRSKLDVFNEISRLEMYGKCISGDMRMIGQVNLCHLNHVAVVRPSEFKINTGHKRKVEKLVHKTIKKHTCLRIEDYPIPGWVKQNKERQRYYIALLGMEIALRKGHKPCQQAN